MRSIDTVKKAACAAALSLALASSVAAVDVAPFTIPSARANAMGGIHAAVADDFQAIFVNPALFVDAGPEVSVAALSVGVYGPVFDMVDSAQTYLDTEKLDFSGLIGPHGLQTGIDVSGPLSFGYVGQGLGFGVFNRSYADAGARGLTLDARVNEDLLLAGGYAFRFAPRSGHIVDAGFLAKGFLRGSLPIESSVLTVTEIGDPYSEKPFDSIAGVGLDLGLRYDFARLFSAAVVCRDLYSPAVVTTYSSAEAFIEGTDEDPTSKYGQIRQRLDIGFSYSPRIELLERYISGLVLALDYHDILDLYELIPRNPILNIGLGVELQVLDVLSLRAGIADALPSAGFGLDMRFARLDFTMRGRELGYDPGYMPVFAMDLDLLFRY